MFINILSISYLYYLNDIINLILNKFSFKFRTKKKKISKFAFKIYNQSPVRIKNLYSVLEYDYIDLIKMIEFFFQK